jgi:hypothetical protein
MYIDGNRLFDAKPTIRFWLAISPLENLHSIRTFRPSVYSVRANLAEMPLAGPMPADYQVTNAVNFLRLLRERKAKRKI